MGHVCLQLANGHLRQDKTLVSGGCSCKMQVCDNLFQSCAALPHESLRATFEEATQHFVFLPCMHRHCLHEL
jgi:hypothetical protein